MTKPPNVTTKRYAIGQNAATQNEPTWNDGTPSSNGRPPRSRASGRV